METKIGIVVGSKSDLPLIKGCENVLDLYGIKYELKVLSAHRTPDETAEYSRNAKKSGIDLIIAGAGMAAHLAGAIAAQTTLPVIGIPIKSGDLGGLDSLLSTVQMPTGIPVATVAVNGAENAAHLAAQILALKYPDIELKIKEIRKEMKKKVLSN
ncbi:MAG: 5-(carboxyamino)imidazole ribonucleotide mutase [Candidatus Anammoxibacter sp.]